jgi:hypothetical protein
MCGRLAKRAALIVLAATGVSETHAFAAVGSVGCRRAAINSLSCSCEATHARREVLLRAGAIAILPGIVVGKPDGAWAQTRSFDEVSPKPGRYYERALMRKRACPLCKR